MTKRECDRQRQLLKSAMKTKEWTHRDLSKASGIHVSTIRRYLGEYGYEEAIRVGGRNALAIARALELEIAAVLGEVESAS